MKTFSQLLLGSLLLTGAQCLLTGCYSDGYVSETVYYGPHRDPWFRDDPWMDNRRWYRDERRDGVDIYISPPRHRH